MKNVTNELIAEHQNILKFIDTMLTECDQLEKGNETKKVFFDKAIVQFWWGSHIVNINYLKLKCQCLIVKNPLIWEGWV